MPDCISAGQLRPLSGDKLSDLRNAVRRQFLGYLRGDASDDLGVARFAKLAYIFHLPSRFLQLQEFRWIARDGPSPAHASPDYSVENLLDDQIDIQRAASVTQEKGF